MDKRLIFPYLLFLVLILALVIVAISGVLGLPQSGLTGQITFGASPENARQTRFVTCLDENGGDEQVCIEKMGVHAWYPRDKTECAAGVRRIDAVLAVKGLPRWPDLFRNERCARLGMPHHEDSVATSVKGYGDRSYLDCYNVDYNHVACDDIHGRHRRHRPSKDDCEAGGSTMSLILANANWEANFENERCWRLGMPHHEPE